MSRPKFSSKMRAAISPEAARFWSSVKNAAFVGGPDGTKMDVSAAEPMPHWLLISAISGLMTSSGGRYLWNEP